ncbi:MAG: 16S rRNA (cytosine(1402)-N(4))-methyltransferase RsmH [Acidiferrobacterales bacterium]
MTAQPHQPVLLNAAVKALAIKPAGFYVDATFGRGGHSLEILSRLGPEGRLLAIDRDPQAVAEAKRKFASEKRLEIKRGPFSMLGQTIQELGQAEKVDGVLLDLGVSSPQLDNAKRGFSFRRTGPLDMRMDPDSGESAADWLNRADEADIARIIKQYGEERFARRIARLIVAERETHPLATTDQLAAICARAVRTREKGKDPATRTFQAIRIYINGELDEITKVLPQAIELLRPGGRLAVISFHSLEDRIVKRFMQKASRGDDYPPDLPVTHDVLKPRIRTIGKAIKADKDEVSRNPRARSAVLRVAERLGELHE